MVRKQEVIHTCKRACLGDDAPGIRPRAVIEALDAWQRTGIYDIAAEFFGWERRYLTPDEVKESIRVRIDDLIALRKRFRQSNHDKEAS